VATESISRDDIQAKFAQLQGQVDDKADTARDTAVTVAVAILALIAVVAFLLGRRRGKQDKTVVEIRRV
jgi:hypothetical protein